MIAAPTDYVEWLTAQDLVTALIVLLGVATVSLSLFAAHVFKTHQAEQSTKGKLAGALKFMLWGEAILGLGTLVFSVGAHFGWLDNWSIWTQSAVRIFMFFAAGATTWHLVRTIRKIKGE